MKKLIFLFTILPFIGNAQNYQIDLSKANQQKIPSPTIWSNVKETILQIPDTLKLQGEVVSMTKDGERIIVSDAFYKILIFDKNGKFMYQLTTPVSEYKDKQESKSQNRFLDTEQNLFFKDAFSHWIGIDLKTGKIMKRIQKPTKYKNKISDFRQIKNGNYISYVNNQSGMEKSLFIIFDEKGQIKYTEPNKSVYVKALQDKPYNMGDYYSYLSNDYCHEPHGGMTVYQIKEDRLLPHITFRLGTHTPIDMNKEMDLFNKTNNNQWIISRVYESNRHIYFSYTAEQKYYWGYYDKMNKKTYIGIGIPQKAYERGVQFPLFYNGIKALTYQKQGNSIKVRIGELL